MVMKQSEATSSGDATFEDAQSASEALPQLTARQRSELLELARATIAAYLETRCIPAYEPTDPGVERQAGAFVTLWALVPAYEATTGKPGAPKKRSAWRLRLRGCMGHTPADLPLCEAVQQVAVMAATADPRVEPLTLEELESILIEISVLSALHRLTDVDQLQIGRHGLLIVKELKRGLLLPEVASRADWDRTAFLENVCLKAGLSPDSWPEAELYVFTTQKFGEAIK